MHYIKQKWYSYNRMVQAGLILNTVWFSRKDIITVKQAYVMWWWIHLENTYTHIRLLCMDALFIANMKSWICRQQIRWCNLECRFHRKCAPITKVRPLGIIAMSDLLFCVTKALSWMFGIICNMKRMLKNEAAEYKYCNRQ